MMSGKNIRVSASLEKIMKDLEGKHKQVHSQDMSGSTLAVDSSDNILRTQ